MVYGTDLWSMARTYGLWHGPMVYGTDVWSMARTYGLWHGPMVLARVMVCIQHGPIVCIMGGWCKVYGMRPMVYGPGLGYMTWLVVYLTHAQRWLIKQRRLALRHLDAHDAKAPHVHLR